MKRTSKKSITKAIELSKEELKKINGGADLKKFAEDLVNLSVKP
ncbi:MAG: bacteriocin [Bacteroidales bacterium]|nr:MAG: bacteriocin [Bacteroidales bacterium]